MAFAFRTAHDGTGIFQRARSASGAFRMKRINRKRKSAGGVYTGAKLKFPIEISGRVLPFWNFIAIESKLLPFYPSDKGMKRCLYFPFDYFNHDLTKNPT